MYTVQSAYNETLQYDQTPQVGHLGVVFFLLSQSLDAIWPLLRFCRPGSRISVSANDEIETCTLYEALQALHLQKTTF